MNTQTKQKDPNELFAKLLHESVMSAEKKQGIALRMKKGEMSKDELKELFMYLVEEEKLRKAVMPKAMKEIEKMADESLERFSQININNYSK